MATTDSSSAFSAFLRPQRADDVVPASLWTPLDTTPTIPDVHTDRRVATILLTIRNTDAPTIDRADH